MPKISIPAAMNVIEKIIKRPPEWIVIILLLLFLAFQPEMKDWVKPLLSLLAIAVPYAAGDFIRKNYYSWKHKHINSSDKRTRSKILEGKGIQDLGILKKALDERNGRGLELVDLENGEQPLFTECFLTKVGHGFSRHHMSKVTRYLLTEDWRDWFHNNDGYLDRLIDQKRKKGQGR